MLRLSISAIEKKDISNQQTAMIEGAMSKCVWVCVSVCDYVFESLWEWMGEGLHLKATHQLRRKLWRQKMRIKEKSKGLLNIFKSAQTPVAVRNHKLKPC